MSLPSRRTGGGTMEGERKQVGIGSWHRIWGWRRSANRGCLKEYGGAGSGGYEEEEPGMASKEGENLAAGTKS
ncbi:hypothetical protein MRB53_005846 [Persea americana]|uniref:Uncharacterized protein n=1 Tax=Persea americana TaxID=3435 RepID=A0ACC2MFD5_PERAE|nr:hypothetical protein MRB53_005846 [Persea americana]